MQGIKISVGLVAFSEDRTAIILTGMSVNPAACKHKNIICAFDALSFDGLISCRLCMALIPNGVAALSRPRRLAEKFNIIWPIAGWSFGSSGNSLEKNGPMILDNILIPPARSA